MSGMPVAATGSKSGHYLYDPDAWARVSSGPIIGFYRSRMHSLFGAGFGNPALNALTMRSEQERRNAGSARGGGSRSAPSVT
jgi:hypothetical protein